MKKPGMLAVAVILAMQFSIWAVSAFVKHEQISKDCLTHVYMAANAADVQTAHKELDIAVSYLEEKKLTSGSTDVLWKCPSNDIGAWYGRLKTTRDSLGRPFDSVNVKFASDGTEIKSSVEYTGMSLVEQAAVFGRMKDILTIRDGSVRHPTMLYAAPNNKLDLAHLTWGILASLAGIVLIIRRFLN